MMERKPFSIEQSEELVANLKSDSASEFEQLKKTLQLLGQVPELSQGMVPPALPSAINENVRSFAKKTSKSHRTAITSIIAAGILVSATLTAAAVTGRGPAPLVSVAHHTAKFVKDVVGSVTHVVTGGHSNPAPESNNVNEQPTVPGVTSTPSPENTSDNGSNTENGNTAASNQNSDNGNTEAANAPVVVQPENTRKGKSGEGETKVSNTPSSTPTGDNSNGENRSSQPSDTPTPEVTPTGGVVPPIGIPSPAPGTSHQDDAPESEGND
ncbi:MAG TPA: hypothetical protein VF307_03385 [Candidatus Nanopelagicaceae bacterium]